MNTLIFSMFALAFSESCKYENRESVFLSYFSEKLEKDADLACEKCIQDCDSLRTFLPSLPSLSSSMKGRATPMVLPNFHYLLQTPIFPPYPPGLEIAYLAMGCFWGVERLYWKQQGVISTAVGYAGGLTPHPIYEEVYTGFTGHTEVVKVVYDPQVTSFRKLLKVFWENHDPTQGMQQGEDLGTQYRSIIFWESQTQKEEAEESRALFQKALYRIGKGEITTEISRLEEFFYAEEYHQQYLAKRPAGYCGIKGTGAYLPGSFE